MSGNTPLVFILDDDAAVRDSLVTLLGASGFVTAPFACGLDFLQAVTSSHRGCLLLDVRLPDMTGLDVMAKLTEMGVRLPVVVITAYGDVPLAVAAMRAGAVDFLEKPYEDEALLRSLYRALDRVARTADEAAMSGAVAERLACLTPREREVLDALVVGKQNKQIAYALGISPRTVEIHRARVMEKMAATSLSHLVRMIIVDGGRGSRP